MPVTPAMVSWLGARSHRSWFEASPLMQQRAKRFELIAEHGPATDDFDALFSPLQADPPGSLDGAYDVKNMPLTDEPQRVQDDLSEIQESAAGSADPLDRS
jgi:hypothetical protein